MNEYKIFVYLHNLDQTTNFVNYMIMTEEFFISLTDSFMRPDTIIIKGESEVLTACSIAQITGQTKTGKTKVLMDIIASCFGKPSAIGLTVNPCPNDKSVLYVNTEMHTYDFWEYLKIIHKLTNNTIQIPNLYFLNALNQSKEIIINNIVEFCKTKKPYLIIIDGIVDLIEDFNDPQKSKTGINKLVSLSNLYSCGILTTLHQNPSIGQNQYSKSRGHLGSHLEQKAISTLVTTKNESTQVFTLYCNKIRRGTSFKVSFVYDKTVDWIKPLNQDTDEDKVYDLLIQLLEDEDKSKQCDIISKIMEETGLSQPTISRRINEYAQQGLILKEGSHKNITLSLN